MDMKVLQIVILALIAAYPEDVLCARRRVGEAKKGYKGPCGERYLRMINNKCYYVSVKKVSLFEIRPTSPSIQFLYGSISPFGR